MAGKSNYTDGWMDVIYMLAGKMLFVTIFQEYAAEICFEFIFG